MGELEAKRSELALLRAGARPEELDRKQKLVETKRVELANARRYQEERNRLAQSLEGKRSQLQLDQKTLTRTRKLVADGLSASVEIDKAEKSVEAQEKRIAEME